MEKELPEYTQLKRILKKIPTHLTTVEDLGVVHLRETQFPLKGLVIGNPSPHVPAFGLVGGVHGLERIGAQIVLSFLESFIEQCEWDKDLEKKLEGIKIVVFPIVNPGGISLGRRSNPRGIDLMRNAPVQADSAVTFLVGGHRISPLLPWFRGWKKDPMQVESEALVKFIQKHTFQSPFVLTLDVHSGFGMRDRVWYPFARTKNPFPYEKEIKSLIDVLNRTHPYHVYRFESQSVNYLTHGDLWDHLFLEHQKSFVGVTPSVFIPLTLEIGSWLWIRKNPRQLFSLAGIFNPILPHRQNRILRRHVSIIDFLLRATKNYTSWIQK